MTPLDGVYPCHGKREARPDCPVHVVRSGCPEHQRISLLPDTTRSRDCRFGLPSKRSPGWASNGVFLGRQSCLPGGVSINSSLEVIRGVHEPPRARGSCLGLFQGTRLTDLRTTRGPKHWTLEAGRCLDPCPRDPVVPSQKPRWDWGGFGGSKGSKSFLGGSKRLLGWSKCLLRRYLDP